MGTVFDRVRSLALGCVRVRVRVCRVRVPLPFLCGRKRVIVPDAGRVCGGSAIPRVLVGLECDKMPYDGIRRACVM